LLTGPAQLLLKLAVTAGLLRLMVIALDRFHQVWPLGPLFGLAVLLWHARRLRDLARWRCLAYLVVVTAVWGATLLLLDHVTLTRPAPFWAWILALQSGLTVITCAQALVLRDSPGRTLLAVFIVPGAFWPFALLGPPTASPVDPFLLLVSFWTVPYLMVMYVRWPPPSLVAGTGPIRY
jgi:hypothetical protein